MESTDPSHDPSCALIELAAADAARERLTGRLHLPAGLHPALAASVALHIGTAAAGIAAQTAAGMVLLGAGLLAYLGVAGWALLRFRQINGVRVDGFASQVVLGASAVAGGTYAWGARQWWRAYRADPARHAPGSTPEVLALLTLSAVIGMVVLVVVG